MHTNSKLPILLRLVALATATFYVDAFRAGVAPLRSASRAVSPLHRLGREIQHPSPHSSRLHASGGFGGGVSSSKKGKGKGKKNSGNKKMPHKEAKRTNSSLLERYGGDLSMGTQKIIDETLATLEPVHLREAALLYKQLTQFEAFVAPMTAGDRRRIIPEAQEDIVNEDRATLAKLREEHAEDDLSDRALHNVYQRATWDASADAKATRASIAGGKMKAELHERVLKACTIAAEAACDDVGLGKVLDVGCGHGTIAPVLVEAGLMEPDMYVGIDLSENMIKFAKDGYGTARNGRTGLGRTFVADDFWAHDFRDDVSAGEDAASPENDDGLFDAVLFCSALHDLPDMEGAIGRAAGLVRSGGGKVIVLHAQGPSHVLGQVRANPVMVKRGLPTTKQWEEMLAADGAEWGLELEVTPADPGSNAEEKDGYLAVLVKR